jgi:hypothetical protein
VLTRATASVIRLLAETDKHQSVETEFGPAIAYTDIVGKVAIGSRVLLNRTACILGLGTGGYDFVMACLDEHSEVPLLRDEHVMKLRYTPSQTAVAALESEPAHKEIWDKTLEGVPVAVGQLHSQIAHCAAAAFAEGKRVAYVMTDAACLFASFSRLVAELTSNGILSVTITAGQAVGGAFETVTIHSALLAARHLAKADLIIVCQGPGNVGTGTRYGFGGVEQASILDIVAALGGVPIAIVRSSEADKRERHRGISHHTLTSLRLVRSRCTIPVPEGMIVENIESRHIVVEVGALEQSFHLLESLGITVTTMGRTPKEDPAFFAAAAAAGKYAATIGNCE